MQPQGARYAKRGEEEGGKETGKAKKRKAKIFFFFLLITFFFTSKNTRARTQTASNRSESTSLLLVRTASPLGLPFRLRESRSGTSESSTRLAEGTIHPCSSTSTAPRALALAATPKTTAQTWEGFKSTRIGSRRRE